MVLWLPIQRHGNCESAHRIPGSLCGRGLLFSFNDATEKNYFSQWIYFIIWNLSHQFHCQNNVVLLSSSSSNTPICFWLDDDRSIRRSIFLEFFCFSVWWPKQWDVAWPSACLLSTIPYCRQWCCFGCCVSSSNYSHLRPELAYLYFWVCWIRWHKSRKQQWQEQAQCRTLAMDPGWAMALWVGKCIWHTHGGRVQSCWRVVQQWCVFMLVVVCLFCCVLCGTILLAKIGL